MHSIGDSTSCNNVQWKIIWKSIYICIYICLSWFNVNGISQWKLISFHSPTWYLWVSLHIYTPVILSFSFLYRILRWKIYSTCYWTFALLQVGLLWKTFIHLFWCISIGHIWKNITFDSDRMNEYGQFCFK